MQFSDRAANNDAVVIQMGTDPDTARARRRRQGKAIRQCRELRQVSIADLAEALDVTPGAVSQWETGRYTPRQHLQVGICKTLGVPHSLIFGLDQEVA